MKIAIYSPYLDTIGGGEKYILTIAEFLSKNHNVDFLLGTHLYDLDIKSTIDKIHDLHNLDLARVNFIKAPIGAGSKAIRRIKFLKGYDFLFYLTDGSIFYSSAKNSILHIQSPLKNTGGLKNKIKLSSWKLIIYNSEFTKSNVEKSWNRPGKVIYPPVSVLEINASRKKKQILSVGRFFGFLRDKKHEFMIDAFKKLDPKDWSLHLVGGAGEGDSEYVDELKNKAQGSKIFIYPNMPLNDLRKLYGQSSIYWHATGFGESEPTKMEHFGITTVEAMAAGVVPVVINLGGQKEIVTQNCGFLWNTEDELLINTRQLIDDGDLMKKLSKEAVKRSKIFSKERFCREINEIIS